jgi:hypothetical protein
LKKALCSAPVLLFPNLVQPFEIEMDALNLWLAQYLNREFTYWHTILRLFLSKISTIIHITKNSTVWYRCWSNETIIFWVKRKFYTLTITCSSSSTHRVRYRNNDIWSGKHTSNSFIWSLNKNGSF